MNAANGTSYPMQCPSHSSSGASSSHHGPPSQTQDLPHPQSQQRHNQPTHQHQASSSTHCHKHRRRHNSLSAFESASSFPDDFLSCSAFSEINVEIFHENAKCDIIIDENLRASDLCHLLTLKMNLTRSLTWSLVLELPDLNLQKVFESDDEVLPLYMQFEKSKSHLSIKSNLKWYDFFENPQNFFPMDMISLDSEEYEPANRIKLTSFADQLANADNLSLTISGPLRYLNHQASRETGSKSMVAQLNGDDDELLCSDMESGHKVAFNVHNHLIFQPINDSKAQMQLSSSTAFIFCIYHEDDKVFKWFAANTELQRIAWLTMFRIVKYGLRTLRNNFSKAKKDAIYSLVSSNASYLRMNRSKYLTREEESHNTIELGKELLLTSSTHHANEARKKYVETKSSSAPNPSFISFPTLVTDIFITDASLSSTHCNKSFDRTLRHATQPWFYPQMSRDEANGSLQKYVNIDGVFLVRPSQRNPGAFVLSYVFNAKVNHAKIQFGDGEDQTCMSLDCGKTKFYDLQQLIEFYQLNFGALPTKLTHFLVHKS